MESKVKLFGHPAHSALVALPLGLLLGSVIFDIASIATGSPWMAMSACATIVAGICGGLIAAPFGLLDYLAIPAHTRAKSIGLVHGLGNVVVLGLFAVSALFRWQHPETADPLAQIFSFSGAGLAMVTGWLGGELVNRLGVGVDNGANLDAPSSLSSAIPGTLHREHRDAPVS